MESIKIKSNKITLAINDDENKIVEINPGDSIERQRYYELYENVKNKEKELKIELQKLDAEKDIKKIMKIDEEVYDYFSKELDKIFGDGTSGKISDGVKDLDLLVQFCEGIAPYFQKYSNEKISKYGNRAQRRSGVMK